jgi:hypothetical protein
MAVDVLGSGGGPFHASALAVSAAAGTLPAKRINAARVNAAGLPPDRPNLTQSVR